MDQQNHAARNLVDTLKETVKKNIVLSQRSGALKIDQSTLSTLVSLVESSFNEGFANGMNVFVREVK